MSSLEDTRVYSNMSSLRPWSYNIPEDTFFKVLVIS
jgi:hypothetical protein